MVLRFLLGVLLVGVGFSVAIFFKEAGYGAGPRDTSGAITGDTKELAFVSNAVGGTVTLLDMVTRTVVGELNVVPDGVRISPFRDPEQWLAQGIVEGRGGLNYAQDTDLSRNGEVLFVSRGYLADVIAMDIASGDILWRTPIAGVRADHMDISPNGKKLYVSAVIRGGNVVEVIDTETGKKLGKIETGDWPHDVHVTEDSQHVYVASLGDMQLEPDIRAENSDSYKVTLADAETYDVLKEFQFEAGVRPFQVTRDQTRLYAQLSNTHAIIARDLETDSEIARIDLPVADGVSEADWDFEAPHHGLALTPNEQTLCVAGRASDYAAIVRSEALSLVTTIPVGDAPSWAEVTEDGWLCVLANTRSDDVSIIDLGTAEEIARIEAGRGPKHITIGRVPEALLASFE